MASRSLVTFLAALGGVLIILGAFLGFFLTFLPNGYGPEYAGIGLFVMAALAIIFGLTILVFSGYTHFQGVGEGWAGALAFIILGILSWAIAGAWLIVAIGALLTAAAGLLLMITILARGPNSRR